MNAPTVGVLLPVRLETRFLPPTAATGWLLRARVVPDAVSITTRSPEPSTLELDAVEAMWREAGSADLETAAGRAAGRVLAGLVGGETAAWLARTFPPVTDAGGAISVVRPTTVRTGMHAPRLHGLPPSMELWLARGGQSPQRVSTLVPLVDEIDIDLDDPDSTELPWWTSFGEAMRVGLAAEIELGAHGDDIDALYVVGVGGGDPGALLTDQADSGRLGLVGPGTATTSVDGASTAAFGSVDTWRRLAQTGAAQQTGADAVRSALGGPVTMPAVVGGDSHHDELDRALVGALWPALWGHTLGNVWGDGGRADELGVWAAQNLVPEGPLPSIRVDTQPYGLLPATALRRWRPAAGDPVIEAALVPLVAGLVATWASTAERAAGAATRPLDSLVRNPAATAYAWRWMLPTEVASAVAFRYADPIARSAIEGWWDAEAAPTARLSPGTPTARRLVATGWAQPMGVPLSGSDAAPDVAASDLGLLARATVGELLDAGPTASGTPGTPPWGRSLLTELARHALLTSAATVARNVAGQPRALVEPVAIDSRSAGQTEVWAARLQPADLHPRRADPAATVHTTVRDSLQVLATHTSSDIERALHAVLDTATDRIDPWATAVAWRRLQSLAAAPRSLGVYAWVDTPRPRVMEPDHRFVLAPSRDQASVAAMLRDRALHDPEASAWDLDLTSDAVRGALRLAGETRQGSHPAESLGRMAERIVARVTVIDRLRDAFPLSTGLEVRRRRVSRVCNGVAVLEAATTNPTSLQSLGVTQGALAALTSLAEAVDALADLHVAESAYGVVKHRTSLVSSASAAAAGEAPPPDRFEVAGTPRTGTAVESTVVVVLPDVPRPTGSAVSPARIADPSVAAFLDDRGGDPDGPQWRWQVVDDNGIGAGTLTLAGIGLRPSDTVGMGVSNLRDTLLAVSGVTALGDGDPAGPAMVRLWATALDGVPAVEPDLGPGEDSGRTTTALSERVGLLRDLAIETIAGARAAASNGPDAARRDALAGLARWGITPMSAARSGEVALADRLAGAADVLERRTAALPAVTTDATVPQLNDAITAMVGAEVGYPVLGRVEAKAFVGVQAEPPSAGSTPRLDPDWLEAVAAVRPALSRLESAQLGERLRRGRTLRAWTNRPGDPWQATAAAPGVGGSRLVAAFGPQGTLPASVSSGSGALVAVAVVDRFAESIPDTEQVASVAFPHDLPTSRAPQAVVLAVPPDVDAELTTDVLVEILAGVRDLARARMTSAAAVGAASSQLHLAAIPAAGRTGVSLGSR